MYAYIAYHHRVIGFRDNSLKEITNGLSHIPINLKDGGHLELVPEPAQA